MAANGEPSGAVFHWRRPDVNVSGRRDETTGCQAAAASASVSASAAALIGRPGHQSAATTRR